MNRREFIIGAACTVPALTISVPGIALARGKNRAFRGRFIVKDLAVGNVVISTPRYAVAHCSWHKTQEGDVPRLVYFRTNASIRPYVHQTVVLGGVEQVTELNYQATRFRYWEPDIIFTQLDKLKNGDCYYCDPVW